VLKQGMVIMSEVGIFCSYRYIIAACFYLVSRIRIISVYFNIMRALCRLCAST
jgi:hypothetical protein